MMKPTLSNITCAALLTAATACTTTETEDNLPADAIPIAALVDQTGTSATLAFSGSIKLAFKQMNEALRRSNQSGIQFRLLLRDTASRTDLAIRHAREAAASGARALITEISADTIAVNALNYDDPPLGLPINCFACSSSLINNPAAVDMDPRRQTAERDQGQYLHRLFMNSRFEAAVQMQIAMDRMDPTGRSAIKGDRNGDDRFKVALIATDDPYGKGWDVALRARMEEMHPDFTKVTETNKTSVEVMYVSPSVNDTSYNWNADLSKLVDNRNENAMAPYKVMDGEPDTVFLALLPVGSGAVTKAFREAYGRMIPLQATTAFRRLHILRALGNYADDVEGGSPQQADPESGVAFQNAFRAEYGEEPEMLTSGSYDCAVTHMLAALVAIADGSDPAAATPGQIQDALNRINNPAGTPVGVGPEEFTKAANIIKAGGAINYRGATGDTKFDKEGDTFPIMVHYKVDKGQFTEDARYTCDNDHPTCQKL
jgi:hypothetical protein